MPGVNDWKTKTLFHEHKEPKTAFNEEVYDRLVAEGYHEGYKHKEYPKVLYPPNYHQTGQRVLDDKNHWTGEWTKFRTVTVKNKDEEQSFLRRGWLAKMPPVVDEEINDFSDEVEDFTVAGSAKPEPKEPIKVALPNHGGQPQPQTQQHAKG